MSPRRCRKAAALAALALAACLWALPAAAETPDAGTPETAAEMQSKQPTAGLGGLTTTGGGAVLIGAGAYSYVRKQRQDARDRRRTEEKAPVYFENHTQTGTLRPEERDRIE